MRSLLLGPPRSPIEVVWLGDVSAYSPARSRSQASDSVPARLAAHRRVRLGSRPRSWCLGFPDRLVRTGRTCRACRGRRARRAWLCLGRRGDFWKPSTVHSRPEPSPASASVALTICRSVTSAGRSAIGARACDPGVPVLVVRDCAARAEIAREQGVNLFRWAAVAAGPSAARKHTAPVPVDCRSNVACKVSAAGGTANSASRFGGTGFVRPSSASRKPMTTRADRGRRRSGPADRDAFAGSDGSTAARPGSCRAAAPVRRRTR